jgi:hypothetical protein
VIARPLPFALAVSAFLALTVALAYDFFVPIHAILVLIAGLWAILNGLAFYFLHYRPIK